MPSLIHTARHKMAELPAMFPRLSNVETFMTHLTTRPQTGCCWSDLLSHIIISPVMLHRLGASLISMSLTSYLTRRRKPTLTNCPDMSVDVRGLSPETEKRPNCRNCGVENLVHSNDLLKTVNIGTFVNRFTPGPASTILLRPAADRTSVLSGADHTLS